MVHHLLQRLECLIDALNLFICCVRPFEAICFTLHFLHYSFKFRILVSDLLLEAIYAVEHGGGADKSQTCDSTGDSQELIVFK